MTTQNNPVDKFIELVEKMRAAQRELEETQSEKARRAVVMLQNMVDAWIVARRLDEKKLAAWIGQGKDLEHDA